MNVHIEVDQQRIADFCRKWKIGEFCLFGSVLRDDFGPESDVDVLVSFEKEAHWSLLDFAEMKMELEDVFHREVDLLTRRAVERSHNWLRRRAILDNVERVYAHE